MDAPGTLPSLVIAAEGLLVIAGLGRWWLARRRPLVPSLHPPWTVGAAPALLLLWAVLVGAFLGHLGGTWLLQSLPEAWRLDEAVQVLCLGGGFHGGCLAAWCFLHTRLAARGERLPPASRDRPGVLASLRGGAQVFCEALPVVLAVALAWGGLLRWLGVPVEQQDLVGVFARTDSVARLAGMMVLALLVAPWNEELLFRAGCYRVLRAWWPRWAALGASGALFAALHANWLGFAPLLAFGVLLARGYERTGNIGVAIVAHGLFNLNSVVLILTLPAEWLQ